MSRSLYVWRLCYRTLSFDLVLLSKVAFFRVDRKDRGNFSISEFENFFENVFLLLIIGSIKELLLNNVFGASRGKGLLSALVEKYITRKKLTMVF